MNNVIIKIRPEVVDQIIFAEISDSSIDRGLFDIFTSQVSLRYS